MTPIQLTVDGNLYVALKALSRQPPNLIQVNDILFLQIQTNMKMILKLIRIYEIQREQ